MANGKLFFGVRVKLFYKTEKFILIFFLFSCSIFDLSQTYLQSLKYSLISMTNGYETDGVTLNKLSCFITTIFSLYLFERYQAMF